MIKQSIWCKVGWHSWTDWEYYIEGKCDQIRYCKRCEIQDKNDISHSWTDWEYYIEGKCDQIRCCKRCENKETRQYHNWENFQNNETINFYMGTPSWVEEEITIGRKCSRCSATEIIDVYRVGH